MMSRKVIQSTIFLFVNLMLAGFAVDLPGAPFVILKIVIILPVAMWGVPDSRSIMDACCIVFEMKGGVNSRREQVFCGLHLIFC